MPTPDAPDSDPLPVHPMSRFLDNPKNLRRRRNDHVPRPPAPKEQLLPDTRKKEIIELPEGRYYIARESEQPGDIEVLAKQYPYSGTWVKMEQG